MLLEITRYHKDNVLLMLKQGSVKTQVMLTNDTTILH